ncbi:MAG: DNA polymerase III subunit delta [Gemmobacter sp.]
MILRGTAALRYLAKPDPAHAGLLIHGADPMRVAMKRAEAIAALIGPDGEAEMRLARMSGADLRRDPAGLSDAMRTQGFFPGPRVAFVEEATDGLADLIAEALGGWRKGDAQVVVTAGALPAKSALRKVFEGHAAAVAVALYDDPPGPDEIAAELARAGLPRPPPAAAEAIAALAATLDPGDFRQMVAKIGLYKWGDASPLTPDDVAACAPATIEAEADDLLAAVATGRTEAVPGLVRRLDGQGMQAVGLCIAALRHFRMLHAAVCDPAGAEAALSRGRPLPPRLKDALLAQARLWGTDPLERAVALLVETDLSLRSQSKAPAMAVMERALIQLTHMVRRMSAGRPGPAPRG